MANSNKKIGVIVTYPKRGEVHSDFSGIAGYTKNLLMGFSSEQREQVVVFSNIKDQTAVFDDEGVEVNECWTRGSMTLVGSIISEIRKYPKLKVIHLQHEFNLFGGASTVFLYLLLLRKLRQSGLSIVVTFHGVVSPKLIDRQFNSINQIQLPVVVTRVLFDLIFRLSARYIDTVIVHEAYFKNVLVDEYGYNIESVTVIFHGVEDLKSHFTQAEAREKMGIGIDKRVVLFFGFLAGYKGLDLLLDTFEALDKEKYVLIIAGGKPRRVESDKNYLKWYNSIIERISKMPNVIKKGFVPNEQVQEYFAATDVLVLPYLVMLSASGPMSFAIGYNKPFLASSAFEGVLPEAIVFDKNAEALSRKIVECFEAKKIFQGYLNGMKEERLWERISAETFKLYQKSV
jgi:glycosyltransferase involved in cell wall biosynthesis